MHMHCGGRAACRFGWPVSALRLCCTAQAEQSIVVLVNDDPITVYDIEQRERFLAVTTQEQPSPALKKKATDMLIEERLQIQQGRKLGITPDEEDVTKVLGGMAQEQQYERRAACHGARPDGRQHQDAQGPHQGSGRLAGRGAEKIPPRRVDRRCRRRQGAGRAPARPSKPREETTLQLRQVKFEIPTDADQAAIAKQLAAVEAVRAKVQTCSNLSTLTKDMKGFKVKTLQDQLPGSLGQPMRDPGDEREDRADDAPHPLRLGRSRPTRCAASMPSRAIRRSGSRPS